MIRRAVLVLAVSSASVLTGCGAFVVSEVPPGDLLRPSASRSSSAEPVPSPVTSSPAPEPVEPLEASVLPVTLDATGRPYDVALEDGVSVSYRPLTTLDTDGEQLVVDGGEYHLGPSVEPVHVPLPASGAVAVGLVVTERDGYPQSSQVAGVVLGDPAAVDRWGPFQYAYGTDGGMGAVWTESAAYDITPEEWPDGRPPVAQTALDRLIAGESWVLTDADGDGDDDGLLFDNGWGDGGFPMSTGVDAQGRVVAVAIWHQWVPWRLGLPVGVPPADVRRAEEAIARCLAEGTQPMDDGTCGQ